MVKVSVTTIDNPFDPIDDFDRWYREDRRLQHFTTERLARLCQASDELGPEDYDGSKIKHGVKCSISNLKGAHTMMFKLGITYWFI